MYDVCTYVCTCVCTVQMNLNFTHTCRHTHVLAHLTHAKLRKLACAHAVVREFGVCTWDSGYMQHTSDACHKLALD